MSFDVAVVGEARDDNQSHLVCVFGEMAKGEDLAAKIQSFLSPFDPMALVEFADEVEHFFAAKPIEVRLECSKQLLVGEPGFFSDLIQQHVNARTALAALIARLAPAVTAARWLTPADASPRASAQ